MDTAGRLKKVTFFPDEIITNILIRLPVKTLVRFELVCKKWRDMILARDFVDLHEKSSIPLTLVASTFKKRLDLFAIDKWWDLTRSRSMIHRFPFCAADFPYASVIFSHAGLTVLRGTRFMFPKPKFIILNPSRPSDECVKIKFSCDFPGDIRAVYYHPSLKEYCSLWRVFVSGRPVLQYKLLNLGANPSFKTICHSFDYSVKGDALNDDAYPLFINDHLYWMLKSEQEDKFGGRNDILEFDIISEEFKVILCPIPLNTKCKTHQTHLLNCDGVIAILLIRPRTVTIWTLKDHVEHLWTATEYTTRVDVLNDFFGVGLVDIIAFVDGNLSFKSGERLFFCNLVDGTVNKFPKSYEGDVLFLSHQTSMASLKNCNSTLYINKDGDVVV